MNKGCVIGLERTKIAKMNKLSRKGEMFLKMGKDKEILKTEAIYLDMEYIKKRLTQFKEIKNGVIYTRVDKSDVDNSKSIYIHFYYNENKYNLFTLRISDHYHNYDKKNGQWQFIVDTEKPICKRREAEFVRCVNGAIKKTERLYFGYLVRKIDRYL